NRTDVCPRQQTADASSVTHASAQVPSARITDRRNIIGISLLDNQHAVVNVTHFSRGNPSAVLPYKFLPNPPAHPPVIREFRFPTIRYGYSNQLVFIIIIHDSRPIAGQIAVEIRGNSRLQADS